jgi:hypothetical protein
MCFCGRSVRAGLTLFAGIHFSTARNIQKQLPALPTGDNRRFSDFDFSGAASFARKGCAPPARP